MFSKYFSGHFKMLIRELFFPMGFIKVGRVFSLLSQVALQGLHQAGVTVDLYGRYTYIYICQEASLWSTI